MDGERFDRWTKALARGRSRRDAVRLVLGGGLGAGLAALGAQGAAAGVAACREAGHPCEGLQDCCDGLVCRVTPPGTAQRCVAACGSEATCSSGRVREEPCRCDGVCCGVGQNCVGRLGQRRCFTPGAGVPAPPFA